MTDTLPERLAPPTEPLADTTAVAVFMHAFDQPVRHRPTTDIPDEERLLRVRLIIEEALEFAEAMGCAVVPTTDGPMPSKGGTRVEIVDGQSIDLVEAADAIADITVVNKGNGHALGVPQDTVFSVVQKSNMDKLGPNGEKYYIDGTTKVGKRPGWVPPTDAIRSILVESGWDE